MTKSRDLADNAQNTKPKVVDAKGDLLVGTGSDAADRLAVSDDGSTLVADSAASTGLRWQGNYAAGKNKIINGDFSINQRSFTSNTTSGLYNFDRWFSFNNAGTVTMSAQTFTPGTAPVSGYEGKNYLRIVTASQANASDGAYVAQRIEDVRTLAAQTVTISFWAKAASGTPSIAVEPQQSFGTGGSSANLVQGQKVAITTSWARYSLTFSIPSISGKTVGANDSYLGILLWVSSGSDRNARLDSLGNQDNTFEIWGVQVEAGSVATAFQTATGTLQGETDLCQRYYIRTVSTADYGRFGNGIYGSSTLGYPVINLPTTMRTAPSSIDYSTLALWDGGAFQAATNVTIHKANPQYVGLEVTVASGGTQYRPCILASNNSTTAYLGFSAEL